MPLPAPLDHLLAIETSGQAASVCVSVRGAVVAEAVLLCPNRHHEVLLGLIDDVLSEAKLPLHALTSLVVGLGPGGFSSVRAGLSTAKGLALCFGLPLAGGSSLRGMALAVRPLTGVVLSVLDARRGELFCLLNSHADGEPGACLGAPSLVPASALGRWLSAQGVVPALCVGDLDGEVLASAQAQLASIGPPPSWQRAVPSARGLVQLASLGLTQRDEGDLEPLYVRAADARLPNVVQRGAVV